MSNNHTDNKPKLPSHIAYSIEQGKNEQSHWHRIGAAWPNKDGSLSVKLNSLPIDGKVNLQLREEIEQMREQKDTTIEQSTGQHEQAPKP